ncbi:hypothetical protein GWK47_044659 [Chionoecetes opilio]|uniref:Uncharacterized protein n=1 Tax=Chionoecetes opilio TaxID=41210 RepID=A0A8J4Y7X6_CHIOP|nr:hypothetical protein GWK47_044659 [Chionoecetes opilio]
MSHFFTCSRTCLSGKLQEDVRSLLCHRTRARIPTQRLDSRVRKLEKLMRKYQNIKKRGDTQARIFQDSPGDLFDIGASDALAQMTFEEDRVFFQMQRQDVTSCSMSGPDLVTAGRESLEAGFWQEQDKARRVKGKAEAASSSVAAAQLTSTSSSNLKSQGDEDFVPTPGFLRVFCASSQATEENLRLPCCRVSLDRVNLSDRGAPVRGRSPWP